MLGPEEQRRPFEPPTVDEDFQHGALSQSRPDALHVHSGLNAALNVEIVQICWCIPRLECVYEGRCYSAVQNTCATSYLLLFREAYLLLGRENVQVELAAGALVSVLFAESTGPSSERTLHIQILDVIPCSKPQRSRTVQVEARGSEHTRPLSWAAVDSVLESGCLGRSDDLTSDLAIPGRAIVPVVTDGDVPLNVDPDTTYLHRVRAEGARDLRELRSKALAGVVRTGAREPIHVDIGISSSTGVLVRLDEVGVHSASRPTGLLISPRNCFREALAKSSGEGRSRNERGRVNAVD